MAILIRKSTWNIKCILVVVKHDESKIMKRCQIHVGKQAHMDSVSCNHVGAIIYASVPVFCVIAHENKPMVCCLRNVYLTGACSYFVALDSMQRSLHSNLVFIHSMWTRRTRTQPAGIAFTPESGRLRGTGCKQAEAGSNTASYLR